MSFRRLVGAACSLACLVVVPAAHAAPAGLLQTAGYNAYGLGDGTNQRLGFAAVPGLGPVASVSGGPYVTLAALPNGTVKAWGYNGYGAVGDGSPYDRPSPVSVLGLSSVVAVASSYQTSYALRSDGTVWSWGYNDYGNLGQGTVDNNAHPTPHQVPGLSGIVAIAAGAESAFALRSDGTVHAWGDDYLGDLGDGDVTHAEKHSPEQIPGLTNVVAVSAGYDDSALALLSNGTLMGWGYNQYGEVGDATTSRRDAPVPVPGLSGVRAISAGSEHSLALLSDGTLAAWGRNNFGQLGDGTTNDSHIPLAVPGVTGARAIVGEEENSLAVLSNGTLQGWGHNRYGELGDGTKAQHKSPEPLPVTPGVYALGQGTSNEYSMILEGAFARISPGSLAFGSARVTHTGTTQSTTLTNAGPAPMLVAGETLTGPGAASFAKLTDSCSGATLPMGGTCTVTLRFTPKSGGALSAVLAFSSTSANALSPVSLSGIGVNVCVVPKLRGKSMKKAKRALKAAHCRLGKVRHNHSSTVKKGHVLSSSPGRGKQRASGAKVKLTLSSG